MDRMIADQAILLSGEPAGPPSRRRQETPVQPPVERHPKEPVVESSPAESAFDTFISGVAETLTLSTARSASIRPPRKKPRQKHRKEPPLDFMIADTADVLTKGVASQSPRHSEPDDVSS